VSARAAGPDLIVYATEYYPPAGAGGAEFTTSLHARLLAGSGRPVLVVTPDFGAGPHDRHGLVEVVRFQTGITLPIGTQVDPALLIGEDFVRRFARAIVAAAGARDVLCIHGQNSWSLDPATRAARELGVPLVTHVRDTANVCGEGAVCLLEPENERPPPHCGALQHVACYLGRSVPLYHREARWIDVAKGAVGAFRRHGLLRARDEIHQTAARIAFASEGIRRVHAVLESFAGESRHRVVYAPVMDRDAPAPAAAEAEAPQAVLAARAAGERLILYAGKVSPGKGTEVLFEAHARLVKRHPAVRLLVAGNAPPGLAARAPPRTELLGFLDRAVLDRVFALTDIVVAPAVWPEPLGWATLDAARHGRPIVASRVGGIPEAVVDGVTGLLVPRLDPGALLEALSRLLEDPAGSETMGRRAREHVRERFGPAAVLAQLEQLYAGLERTAIRDSGSSSAGTNEPRPR
jgi:glycosyltransferase involved in cell wall biosynthesis